MKPFERLGNARTPDGSLLELFRHDGSYLIRANGIELMSQRRHLSEDQLAVVACKGLKEKVGARVLIGGLGLGFTLRAALNEVAADAEVVVAEFLEEVIAWNANPEYGISVDTLQDPRVRIVHDDIVNVLRDHAGQFDAIILDTDNGPDGIIMSENARLYNKLGINTTVAALRPPGIIAYWSVGDDPGFAHALRQNALNVEVLRVRAHDTKGPMHTLYVATPKRGPRK